jgi:ABC-type lipoprotein export system ATPase subunit
VFALMREMNRETGVAVILVTHDDFHRLAQAADRIMLIEDGRMQELSTEQHAERTVGQRAGALETADERG